MSDLSWGQVLKVLRKRRDFLHLRSIEGDKAGKDLTYDKAEYAALSKVIWLLEDKQAGKTECYPNVWGDKKEV